WTKLLADALERPVVEARADLRDVDELALVVEAQMQGSEVRARSLGHRVSADDELLSEMALDLEPIPGALRRVRAVAPLGDDALQSLLAGGGEEIRPLAEHVIAEI